MSSAQTGGKRAPSAWTKFVTKFYHDEKKKNPEYKFSQALKDAAKVYKKTSKTGGSRNNDDNDNDNDNDEDDDSDMEGGKKKKKRTVRRKKTTKKKRTTRK
jgi:hypothetical protein